MCSARTSLQPSQQEVFKFSSFQGRVFKKFKFSKYFFPENRTRTRILDETPSQGQSTQPAGSTSPVTLLLVWPSAVSRAIIINTYCCSRLETGERDSTSLYCSSSRKLIILLIIFVSDSSSPYCFLFLVCSCF